LEETLVFFVNDKVSRVRLAIKDKDILSSDILATTVALTSENVLKKTVALDPRGSITYSLTMVPIQVAAGLAHSFVVPAGFSCKVRGDYSKLLVMNVQSAKVRNADWCGKSDPYLFVNKFTGGKSMIEKYHGPVHENNLAPVFNETHATLLTPDVSSYKVEIYDFDDVGAADLLGAHDVSTASRVTSGTFPLAPSGEITMSSYVVPLEVICTAAQSGHPFVSTIPLHQVKTGEGFELAVYYTSPHESSIEVVASVDGKPFAEHRQSVHASGITSIKVPLTPKIVIPVGKVITIETALKIAGVGVAATKLADSKITVVVK